MVHERKQLLDKAILLTVCLLLCDPEYARSSMAGVDGRVSLIDPDTLINTLHHRVESLELEELQQLVNEADAAASRLQQATNVGATNEEVLAADLAVSRCTKQVADEMLRLVRAHQVPSELLN